MRGGSQPVSPTGSPAPALPLGHAAHESRLPLTITELMEPQSLTSRLQQVGPSPIQKEENVSNLSPHGFLILRSLRCLRVHVFRPELGRAGRADSAWAQPLQGMGGRELSEGQKDPAEVPRGFSKYVTVTCSALSHLPGDVRLLGPHSQGTRNQSPPPSRPVLPVLQILQALIKHLLCAGLNSPAPLHHRH